MEIKEILNYYLNNDTNILEVSFRTIEDSEEVLRNDTINYSIVADYGFNIISESFDFFEDDLFDDYDDEEETTLDEPELLSFLTEYYTVNPDLLPKAEFY